MEKIRIATFNVYYGKNPDKFSDAILKNENLSKADVILLQEVESYPEEGKARAEIIAENLGMNCVYTPARDTGIDGTHGLAILSKFKILETEVVPLPFFKLRRNPRQRIAVSAVIEIEGMQLVVANVHLDTMLNIKNRIEQVNAIVENLKSHKIQKIVMAGDFNTLPFVFLWKLVPIFYYNQRRKFYEFLRSNGFETSMDKLGYTLRSRIFKFSLDSIFVRGLKIEDFGIERSVIVSDHHPIWVDIVY